MGRLIDADSLKEKFGACMFKGDTIISIINEQYTVEAIPKDHITRAIDKVEEYICDVETDTVKAQGMAQALDIIEQVLGEL